MKKTILYFIVAAEFLVILLLAIFLYGSRSQIEYWKKQSANLNSQEELSHLQSENFSLKNENGQLKQAIKKQELKSKFGNKTLQYKNDELGITFTYPAFLGELKIDINDDGREFIGEFSNVRVQIGGLGKNYKSDGRDGWPTDFSGFEKKGDKYFSDNSEITDISRILPNDVIIDKGATPLAGDPYIRALANLKNSTFPGIAFVDLDLDFLTEKEFEDMVLTLQIYKN